MSMSRQWKNIKSPNLLAFNLTKYLHSFLYCFLYNSWSKCSRCAPNYNVAFSEVGIIFPFFLSQSLNFLPEGLELLFSFLCAFIIRKRKKIGLKITKFTVNGRRGPPSSQILDDNHDQMTRKHLNVYVTEMNALTSVFSKLDLS